MQKPVPVALVYGESESSQGLRDALGKIGADLVCDIDVESFNVENLGASGAGIVLISLDGVIEARLDEIYGALDEDRFRVMFDDPEISNSLDGWEQARWQRHLAAKLCDIADWDPPRPEDAEPVAVEAADTATVPDQGTALDQAEEPDWMDEALSVLSDADRGADDDASVTGDEAAAADPAPAPDIDAESASTHETASQSAPLAGTGMDADDADLDELAAQLDALADADDPLAALSALAQEDSEQGEANPDAEAADAASETDRADDGDQEPAAAPASEPPDVSAQGSTSEPEATVPPAAATEVTGDAGDTDWNALEADLNAAFDTDMLDAIEQAAASETPQVEKPAGWEAQDGGELAGDPPKAAESAPPLVDSQSPDEFAQVHDEAAPDEEAAPSATPAESDAAAAETTTDSAPQLPDVSEWALVDDEPAPAEEPEQPAPVPDSTAAESVPQDEGAATGDAEDVQIEEADDDFGLELVDPIDYLKPEAPPEDVSTELFNMPSLMPMAEAVAPRTGEDPDEPRDSRSSVERVVVLGASIGGPDAVREFLSHLPQQLPATVLLVQHLGAEFVDLMVSQMAKSSALPVRIPGSAERAVHGEVLVVPSGRNIDLAGDGQVQLKAVDDATANDPAISRTLRMAAEAFGAGATAIIFSGMAPDVTEGAAEISSRGGEVWVQEPDSCVVSKMVDEVIEAGAAHFIGSPEALAQKLVAHLQETDNAKDQ